MSEAEPPEGRRLLQSAIDVAQDLGYGDDAWDTENARHSWGHEPNSLESVSLVDTYSIGTGEEIFRDTLLPALESANADVTLVTCFWAQSESLNLLSQGLRRLSSKAVHRNNGTTIRVSIGFSSRSLMQKLLHTADPAGYIYPPGEWTSALGLPSSAELPGLSMTVKSLFFRPFSVMHPKYLIVDGQRLWMPSCNVSWESWYEGCLSLRGPIVQQVARFCYRVWQFPFAGYGPFNPFNLGESEALKASDARSIIIGRGAQVTLLPSQHHTEWSHSLPRLKSMCPATPLNLSLLHLLADARTNIELVTPNLTCSHVVEALVEAIVRGVNVSITTNRKMMIVEQLATSFSVTELWIWRLIRRYLSLPRQGHRDGRLSNARDPALLEDARAEVNLGRLEIHYFDPSISSGAENGHCVKTHVKCTIIDDSIAVLGSGNMDRASWYTSQELGVAMQDPQAVQKIQQLLRTGLHGQTRQHFPTTAS